MSLWPSFSTAVLPLTTTMNDVAHPGPSNFDYLVVHSDLRRVTAENEALKSVVKRLTDDLEDLKHDKRSYRASKERVEADLDAARRSLEDTRSSLDEARMLNDELTEKLEDRDRDNEYLRKMLEEESQEDTKWFMIVEQLQAKVAVRQCTSCPGTCEVHPSFV